MSLHPKYEVVVHEPRDVTGKIAKANSIKAAIGTSTWIGTPSPPIVDFASHIKDATDYEAATKTNPPTKTTAQRDGKVDIMDDDIESYRLKAQALVNDPANADHAEEIVDSFDMELKTHTSAGPRQDELLDGPFPNSCLYRMKGTGPHQIQMSMDAAGSTPLPVDPSKAGKKVIRNLTLKVDVWFRNRQIIGEDLYSDWTDWKKFTPRK